MHSSPPPYTAFLALVVHVSPFQHLTFLWIVSVAFDVIRVDYLLIGYLAFVKYLREKWGIQCSSTLVVYALEISANLAIASSAWCRQHSAACSYPERN